MDLLKQFSELLPIHAPFVINSLEKDEGKQEVHIHLIVDKRGIPPPHSLHSYYARTWEHLPLFQYRCFIHSRLPIDKTKDTGDLFKASVSFSRDYARFTLLYEQEVMRLMKIPHCLSTVAKNLKIHIQRVETIYHD